MFKDNDINIIFFIGYGLFEISEFHPLLEKWMIIKIGDGLHIAMQPARLTTIKRRPKGVNPRYVDCGVHRSDGDEPCMHALGCFVLWKIRFLLIYLELPPSALSLESHGKLFVCKSRIDPFCRLPLLPSPVGDFEDTP
jgi:hypothetical protein